MQLLLLSVTVGTGGRPGYGRLWHPLAFVWARSEDTSESQNGVQNRPGWIAAPAVYMRIGPGSKSGWARLMHPPGNGGRLD